MALLGAGTHDVVVVGSWMGKSGANETKHIRVLFEDAKGDRATAFLYLSTKAWPYAQKNLETLGWNAVERKFLFEELDQADLSPIKGNKCQVVVKVEEYPPGSGTMNPKVQWINEAGGGTGGERMEPAQAKSFADELRASLGVGGGGTRRAPPNPAKAERDKLEPPKDAQGAQEPEDYDFDDIPF